MRAKLHQHVLTAISRRKMFVPGDRVGVAVSGGADSVALLRLLVDLQADLGVRLVVLHFQHGLRGEESQADEQFVAALAARLGLDFGRQGHDVAAWARAQRVNLEEAGRRLRSAFFEEEVLAGRVTRVATAHTADDQAETVVAHMLRGSGLAGLAGIHPVAGPVVRPLLEVRRHELRAWLQTIGQEWREDSTNADLSRLRARLRRQVLPQLEELQPGLVEHLGALAGLARDDEQFWKTLAASRFAALATKTDKGVVLRVQDLLCPLAIPGVGAETCQAALSRRIVRHAVEALLGHRRGLSAAHVESVLRLASRPLSGHRVELPHRVMAERSFDQISFSAEPRGERLRDTPQAFAVPVTLPARGDAQVIVPAIRRRLRLKVVDWPGGALDTTSSEEALDAERLRPPVLFRNWHPGDVFCPRGRRRARKLKELLREACVASGDRRLWPVLQSGAGLVWVRGLPPAAACIPGPDTKAALLISEEEL